tara:strand:+ start:468 stop:1604 length:1137 start_codon:yes stop_codon:yes gene_type:complete
MLNFNEKIVFKKFLTDSAYFFLFVSLSITLIVWVVQAVNFLDFVSEDGHSFKIYFYYTILNLPKIFSRILPVVFFISLFYTIIKYEENNELKIFWLNGINKIKFLNVIIKYSLLFFVLQIFLSTLIIPIFQGKARMFLKNSSLDFFPSLLQEKKFIDTVDKLTIFIDKKNSLNNFQNIFLKDEINNNQSQIIYAKKGVLKNENDKRSLILFDGKFLNTNYKKTTVFNFDSTEIDLTKYDTKSITHPKIQEHNTMLLFRCFDYFYIKKNFLENTSTKCGESKIFIKEIKQEIFKRIVKPFYLFVVAIIVSFLLMNYKENHKYEFIKSCIFSLGIIILIISEVSITYSGKSDFNSLITSLLPLILFVFSYLGLKKKLFKI